MSYMKLVRTILSDWAWFKAPIGD